jgi:hypothetical protein
MHRALSTGLFFQSELLFWLSLLPMGFSCAMQGTKQMSPPNPRGIPYAGRYRAMSGQP